MKKIIFTATAALLICSSCKKEANELAHNHNHSHHTEADNDSRDDIHDHNHAGEIELPVEQAEKLGIGTIAVHPADFAEVVSVSGQITPSPSDQSTVSSRSAGIIHLSKGITEGIKITKGQTIASISAKGIAGGDANEAAGVALKAAKRELDRLTPLHADGIVSTRDFNAARQRYEEALAAASAGISAGSCATASTSGVITQLLVNEGQFVEAGQPIATISGSSIMTLRADLPESQLKFLPRITGARFRPSYTDETIDISSLNGHLNSSLTSSVVTGGYLPVYFTFENNGMIIGGTYCDVYLTGSLRHNIISIPESAISEQQGKYFVYTEVHDGHYSKIPVELGQSDGLRREIISGLHDGDKVVTTGMTFVRLAESADVAPEGHSHNH